MPDNRESKHVRQKLPREEDDSLLELETSTPFLPSVVSGPSRQKISKDIAEFQSTKMPIPKGNNRRHRAGRMFHEWTQVLVPWRGSQNTVFWAPGPVLWETLPSTLSSSAISGLGFRESMLPGCYTRTQTLCHIPDSFDSVPHPQF